MFFLARSKRRACLRLVAYWNKKKELLVLVPHICFFEVLTSHGIPTQAFMITFIIFSSLSTLCSNSCWVSLWSHARLASFLPSLLKTTVRTEKVPLSYSNDAQGRGEQRSSTRPALKYRVNHTSRAIERNLNTPNSICCLHLPNKLLLNIYLVLLCSSTDRRHFS